MTAPRRQARLRTCRLPTTMLALELTKKILRADEVIVEDPPRGVEHVPNQRVPHGIPHARAFFTTGDDVVRAKNRQLLRDDRLLDTECFLELLDVPVAVHEQFENVNAKRMRERSEERGLECLKFLGSELGHIFILLA